MADLNHWRHRRSVRARARAAEFAAGASHLEGADLLEVAIKEAFVGDIAIASSFGTEAVALLALAAEIDPAVPVIFLDTGKLFPEALAYRRTVVEHLGLTHVRTAGPDILDIAAIDASGDLWKRQPDACCYLRKVVPLVQAVTPYGAWITGRKRYQGDGRAALQPIEASDGWVKINPLAHWTKQDIFGLIAQRKLPKHPLLEHGYLSVGCQPCTQPVTPLGDERDRRWSGQDKSECGIHTIAPEAPLGHAGSGDQGATI
ncbi:MAG: phosphoadenylyl-sulfate reductase [Alphaproteobacteria bacterium]|jgi:phosphoadenosine phosphosulfate reductase|nr:phosphoadenylyl-sulfate reductase [Rhodospirillaceae bacterium]MDG2482574.1 phosphoadenylyl-sulfate reductase [Alphaproteobacteria bacterium]MBT6203545.1 phosphoadenylyl-sulfate reductase [Rhodospirillaceae bacterium]MBT6513120.1 phosphoadenylyl-sulfate reductase [Rhodospirillaceae bacterium]MBT7611594.1 phosphoadenylyl-sulfate reductase [Rhodospirillaceae bacterium]